ncbi:MAG: hypothetical protein OMM_01224 [Candidatus Magnetoglobus multicellularis str. Araruama]|uniref:TIR domain-containing protein n=1 Tax=Candidatus Magnetoglobus multicellularis str. Araruama TaxID=890399 RepID=A0A1V1PEK1_9BACT|nr:MAG: hypothetical protein OMM_01224 [Candidatus Magnetoglobus multicellularis str. Araruama]
MKSIFISHSNKDKEIARKISADLQARGIRIWLDEAEIKIGDSLIQKISEAIKTTDFILVLLTENSVNSVWVQKEIKTALNREIESKQKYLLPVVVGNPELPSFLMDRLYVNLDESYEEGISSIVNTVNRQSPVDKKDIDSVLDTSDFAKEVAKEVAEILKINQSGIRIEDPNQTDVDEKLVFVIISFSSDMEPIFEGIKAAGEHFGLKVERVKDVQGDYKITDKIVDMIDRAFIVVADLTHERPNVYFELGYARGKNKNVVTTAREGTKVHFDVKDWTYTSYTDSRILEKHLKNRFEFELSNRK